MVWGHGCEVDKIIDGEKLWRSVAFTNCYNISCVSFCFSAKMLNTQKHLLYTNSNFVRLAFGRGVVKNRCFPERPKGKNFV